MDRPRGTLGTHERETLRSLISGMRFELIPLRRALEAAEVLARESTVTITASPSHGMEATLDLAEKLAARGHIVVPHLAAHMVRDRGHLRELLLRCTKAGITNALVVGGDAKDPGAFRDGLSLLRAMTELGHPFKDIGVPAYPQGHPEILDPILIRALREKLPFVHHLTTQMCFDPSTIAEWIRRMRTEGFALPIHLGVPGVAELTKLFTIAAKIGVAESARYLRKHRRIIGHLVQGRFGPDELLEELAPTLVDPSAGVRTLHVFTFNQVEATVDWQRRMLEELDAS